MQKEKDFLIQVLADHLNKRATVVPDNLNWHVLEKISREQKLSGILYHQCKSSIVRSDLPKEAKINWRQGYLYNSFLYVTRLALLRRIEKEFQKENIAYAVFKGIEVAAFYPVPAHRTMGDLDLLVHPEDKQRAFEALTRLGFTMKLQTSDEWITEKNEMIIELHHKLIYAHSIEWEIIQTWGNRVWDYTAEQKNIIQRKLDLTYHLVYLLLHLRKHLLENGVAFRQFMDVAVIASQPGVNWKQAENWLKELELTKFSQTCFAFCERWFGTTIQIGKIELKEDFYNDYTEKIFVGGMFGSNDPDIKDNTIFNKMHYDNSSDSGTSIFLRHALLPYKKMCDLPYCSFLKGKPYLLPVAWCWRFVYKMGNLMPLLKGAYDKETIKKKEDMLSNWGL
jgi:hypothetical protein